VPDLAVDSLCVAAVKQGLHVTQITPVLPRRFEVTADPCRLVTRLLALGAQVDLVEVANAQRLRELERGVLAKMPWLC
jgi:hypothetical protein